MTLSVAEDLGDYVPRATLQTDLTHLLRTLIQRVEGFAERANPAGARLLGEVTAAGELPAWRVQGLNVQPMPGLDRLEQLTLLRPELEVEQARLVTRPKEPYPSHCESFSSRAAR